MRRTPARVTPHTQGPSHRQQAPSCRNAPPGAVQDPVAAQQVVVEGGCGLGPGASTKAKQKAGALPLAPGAAGPGNEGQEHCRAAACTAREVWALGQGPGTGSTICDATMEQSQGRPAGPSGQRARHPRPHCTIAVWWAWPYVHGFPGARARSPHLPLRPSPPPTEKGPGGRPIAGSGRSVAQKTNAQQVRRPHRAREEERTAAAVWAQPAAGTHSGSGLPTDCGQQPGTRRLGTWNMAGVLKGLGGGFCLILVKLRLNCHHTWLWLPYD